MRLRVSVTACPSVGQLVHHSLVEKLEIMERDHFWQSIAQYECIFSPWRKHGTVTPYMVHACQNDSKYDWLKSSDPGLLHYITNETCLHNIQNVLSIANSYCPFHWSDFLAQLRDEGRFSWKILKVIVDLNHPTICLFAEHAYCWTRFLLDLVFIR